MARSTRRIRYAVAGLGHIAQAAVLPAFANARKNSELVALVSGDAKKRRRLGRRYDVPSFGYEDYDELCSSGEIDAVYIALPNTMHRDFTVRAANAGVHVLCEKPMATDERECEEMIATCAANRVKLMIAYRLHFEEANLAAVDVVRKGKLGEARMFSSIFAYQVREGNIRTQAALGGGPLDDIGIYCVNAARYLFRDEPIEVAGFGIGGREPRFHEVEEAVSAMLRFPDERLAVFTCSFGASDVAYYRVVGTKGLLHVEPAYEYATELAYTLQVGGKEQKKTFPKRDQFAPELLYFSECVTRDIEPEPSGIEGLADIRVLKAIERSMALGRPISLAPFHPPKRPMPDQAMRRPAVKEPALVDTEPPSH